jgi:D-alanyl-lipoteichoic acid acyltransferase DltB (MBOAT superfamily)
MLFNSIHFLIFFPIVTILFYLLKHKWRWVLLFFASTYFYSAFYLPYILILYVIIIIDYICGLLIEKSENKLKLFWLILSIVSNIGLLAYFKYYNFFVDVFIDFVPNIKHISIILPIGLSFHTFQSLSYTIEVYKGNQKAEKHIGYFANYVLFFPQMVAGPIETYAHLGNELKTKHKFKYKNIASGLRLILYGLFVKMCIADNFAPLVNDFYNNPTQFHFAYAWLALFAFSVQIYADFYGYSTIAIGAAKLLGIELMNNFKQPYFANSFYQFWQRWHISLTTWFRNYVFFPLGGSYVNWFKWIFNILLVFALSGFWHGANYTFIIWGLAHGVFYLLEKQFFKIVPININSNKFLKAFGGLITFLLVTLIWVLFRAENVDKAIAVFKQCFSYSLITKNQLTVNFETAFLFFLFLFFEILIYKSRFDFYIKELNVFIRWAVYTTLILCIILFSGIQSFQFIYFQF